MSCAVRLSVRVVTRCGLVVVCNRLHTAERDGGADTRANFMDKVSARVQPGTSAGIYACVCGSGHMEVCTTTPGKNVDWQGHAQAKETGETFLHWFMDMYNRAHGIVHK